MQENPYSAILNTVRSDTDARTADVWRLGLVKSVEPLRIETCGKELFGKDLLVNAQLLPNVEPVELSAITGALTATVDCGVGSITKIQVSGGTLAASGLFGGILHPGDQVALLPSRDGQIYLVACKVVSV